MKKLSFLNLKHRVLVIVKEIHEKPGPINPSRHKNILITKSLPTPNYLNMMIMCTMVSGNILFAIGRLGPLFFFNSMDLDFLETRMKKKRKKEKKRKKTMYR